LSNTHAPQTALLDPPTQRKRSTSKRWLESQLDGPKTEKVTRQNNHQTAICKDPVKNHSQELPLLSSTARSRQLPPRGAAEHHCKKPPLQSTTARSRKVPQKDIEQRSYSTI
jgi:hypothetical protein